MGLHWSAKGQSAQLVLCCWIFMYNSLSLSWIAVYGSELIWSFVVHVTYCLQDLGVKHIFLN